MKAKIIGILAGKNLFSQGYPFLEAIYSFLNWGDELYISDGYSNDETYKILKRLSKNKRIHVYKYKWPQLSNGRAIAAAYNNLIFTAKRRTNKSDYIFQLQANEIVHESEYTRLRSLPEEYPKTKLFIFPYNILCWKFILGYDWRFRFAKANQDIKSFGDGAFIETVNEVTLRDALKDSLKSIYKLIKTGQYYSRLFNIAANVSKRKHPALYKAYPLYPPIFRYSFIFPKNIEMKFSGHKNLWGKNGYNGIKFDDIIKHFLNKEGVETAYLEFIKNLNLHNDNTNYNDIIKRTKLENLNHPSIMKNIINLYEYKMRESVIQEILKNTSI